MTDATDDLEDQEIERHAKKLFKQKKAESLGFNYAIEAFSVQEVEMLVRDSGLKREQFRICVDVSQIAGKRFPTKELLFIMPELHYEAKRRGLLK